MNLSAVDRVSPVYVNAVRDPYVAEALGAQNRIDRFARVQPAQSARIQALREQPAATSAMAVQHSAATGRDASTVDKCDPGEPANWLCDQYATERLSSAVQAFIDEQEALRQRANGAINLGTLEGLSPFQRYFMAFSNPPIELQQAAVAATVPPAMVGPIANVAATRSTTEDALGSDGATRALIRARRPRGTDA